MLACGPCLLALVLAAPPARVVVDWLPRVFPLAGAGIIEVEVDAGAVEVVAGPEGRATVQGQLRATGPDLETAKSTSRLLTVQAKREGETLSVRVERPRGQPAQTATETELHLEVPARATVRIRMRSGNIVTRHLLGPADLATRVGSIRVDLGGPVTVHAEADRGRVQQSLGLRTVPRGRGVLVDGAVGGGGPPLQLKTGQGTVVLTQRLP